MTSRCRCRRLSRWSSRRSSLPFPGVRQQPPVIAICPPAAPWKTQVPVALARHLEKREPLSVALQPGKVGAP